MTSSIRGNNQNGCFLWKLWCRIDKYLECPMQRKASAYCWQCCVVFKQLGNKTVKTRRRATLLLPTWICSCQSVGTVNFALPFTTSVTISISILQTFRSWVATSHLRPPMAFLSHNSSDTPGLAPLMNVLFWGRCDFPISFSGRDMSRNVWNRL